MLPHSQYASELDESMAETVNQMHHAQAALPNKGLKIWAETIDDLIRQLPFELDADLEHLYSLEGRVSADYVPDMMNFPRDVGACCERGADAMDNQDNFACLQVDDLANPWGLHVVADGSGPQGHLVSTLLVHELPSLLIQNPGLHRNPNMALYQALLSVSQMANSCHFIDPSVSGGSLSTVFMHEGSLHVAWAGDCKVVLGRLIKPSTATGNENAEQKPVAHGNVRLIESRRGAARAVGNPNVGGSSIAASGCSRPVPDVSCPIPLRSVELTADSSTALAFDSSNCVGATSNGSQDSIDTADGAGGPPQRKDTCSEQCNQDHVTARNTLKPEIRQLHLTPDDVFFVLGTSGLWKQLSPIEVVTIVGQRMHGSATAAAKALLAEVERRGLPGRCRDDITILVVYLAGSRFVSEYAHVSSCPQREGREFRMTRDGESRCGWLLVSPEIRSNPAQTSS